MLGHPHSQKFAEPSNPGSGNRAEIVKNFFDPTRGEHAEQERETDSQIHLQALLYDRGCIYLSGEKVVQRHGDSCSTARFVFSKR
jgi:hypothetical protein